MGGWKAKQTQQETDVFERFKGGFGPFNSLAVEQYTPIFDIKPFVVSKFADRDFTTGTATIAVEQGEYRLYNPGGETCRLETALRGRYEPGMKGVPGVALRESIAPSGTTAIRWGYFDTTNTTGGGDGFGIEKDANGLRTFVQSKGTTVYTKERKDWLDPLNGKGPSGVNIDLSHGYIFRFPFLWYGYGPITFGVVVSPDGVEEEAKTIIVDRYLPQDAVSVKNPNLPITVEISGDSESEVYITGRQFGIYGKVSYQPRVVGDIRAGQSVSDTEFVPTIAAKIRQETPWINVLARLSALRLQTDSDLDWYMALGGTLDTGATWNVSQFADSGDTAMEFSVDASSISGQEIFGGPGFAISGGGNKIGAAEAGLPDADAPIGEIFTLMVKSQSGAATVRSTLEVAELR